MHVLVHTQRNACGQAVMEWNIKTDSVKTTKIDCFSDYFIKLPHLQQTSAFMEEFDPSELPGAWLDSSCTFAMLLHVRVQLKNSSETAFQSVHCECFIPIYCFKVPAAIGWPPLCPRLAQLLSRSWPIGGSPSRRTAVCLQLLWRHWQNQACAHSHEG